MKPLQDLTDDEIDGLLLLLFGGDPADATRTKPQEKIENKSNADLKRIRSRNHPDKWPNVDLDAYRAATEEIDRRRLSGSDKSL